MRKNCESSVADDLHSIRKRAEDMSGLFSELEEVMDELIKENKELHLQNAMLRRRLLNGN